MVRAIYEQGKLRLLDTVDLQEGQEVNLTIVPDALSVLSDLLVQVDTTLDENVDEEALLREIEVAFAGQPPLSEDIIQERHDAP